MVTAMTSCRRDARRRDLRHEERHRERDDQIDDRHRERGADRAHGDVAVDVVVEDRAVVVERRVGHHLGGHADRLVVVQRRDQQRDERADVGDEQPQQRPRQREPEAQRGAARRASAAGRRGGPDGSSSRSDRSALHLGPRRDPLGVVLALDVGAPVEALLGRRRPVVQLARSTPRRRRGTARSARRPSSHAARLAGASPKVEATSACTGGRGDVVDPLVGAVRVLGLGVDHPVVGPRRRALLRQHGVDRGRRVVGLERVGDDLPAACPARCCPARKLSS